MNDDNILPIFGQEKMRESLHRLKSGGDGPYDGGMEARISHLEALSASTDKRLDSIERRLDRIEDKIPSKWDMAQVVFYVVGGLMAAAIFGPRLVALLPPAG